MTDALGRLDPASRALLDLSLRRDMPPGEIAEVLGIEPDDVIELREAALHEVAARAGLSEGAELGEARARLKELPSESWLGGGVSAGTENGGRSPGVASPSEPASPQAGARAEDGGGGKAGASEELEAEPADSAHDERSASRAATLELAGADGPERLGSAAREAGAASSAAGSSIASGEPREAPARAAPRRRQALAVALAGALLIAAAIAVPLSLTGTSHHPAAPSPPGSRSSGAGASASSFAAKPLSPVAGAPKAHGSAQLTDGGKRIRLSISGLPRGSYAAWLYNSVIDSVPLGHFGGSSATIEAALPSGYRRFRLIDVSLQPGANPNHSGESVLRVPLAALTRSR